MTTLGPGEIRARKRPGLVLAVAGLRALAGLCLAGPLAALIATSGIGLRSEGDRALFEGGGYLLLDLARLQGGNLLALVRGLLPLFLIGLLLTTACNGALLVALNARERLKSTDWLARTRACVPALLVLGAGTALGQAVLIGAVALGAGAIPESLANPIGSSALQVSLLALAILLASALGGLSDVAKAALVRNEIRVSEALARSFRCLRRRPLLACFGWFPYALSFLAAAWLGAKLTEALDVSRAGAWRVGAVLVVHQLVVVAAVAARTGWFARALRFVTSDA